MAPENLKRMFRSNHSQAVKLGELRPSCKKDSFSNGTPDRHVSYGRRNDNSQPCFQTREGIFWYLAVNFPKLSDA
jgi:hypothetical protein